MTRIFFMAAVFFVSVSSVASAGWYHQKLHLVNENDQLDQISVSVDFEVKRGEGNLQFAEPVYFNVWRDGTYTENGQVLIRTLVFNDYLTSFVDMIERKYEYFARFRDEQTISLSSQGQHLTGKAEEPIYLVGKKETEYSKYFPQGFQEIAVVIDGTWYKGFNGMNARFSMYEHYYKSRRNK